MRARGSQLVAKINVDGRGRGTAAATSGGTTTAAGRGTTTTTTIAGSVAIGRRRGRGRGSLFWHWKLGIGMSTMQHFIPANEIRRRSTRLGDAIFSSQASFNNFFVVTGHGEP
ncbi:hypothetical protein Salat_0674500 [Sesamum alatum]|uniref:Uncharacterized protein n=1 Tax=Sesamum alatum TaxID=300844 RepID=A0AAE1YS15_9LAMI|nr:hypothetical protein Salat_0674500 [Sesamum alatum]